MAGTKEPTRQQIWPAQPYGVRSPATMASTAAATITGTISAITACAGLNALAPGRGSAPAGSAGRTSPATRSALGRKRIARLLSPPEPCCPCPRDSRALAAIEDELSAFDPG